MINTSNVQIVINLRNPSLDDDELEVETQALLCQLQELDEVERVDRILDITPPVGNKSIGAALIGLLKADVSAQNLKGLLTFLSERLGSKPIELEVEANGKKLKVKASGQKELQAAIQAAQEFVKA